MLAQLERRQGGKGVSMLRGTDDHRIKFLLVVKQFAEVIRFAGLGVFHRRGIQVPLVDIAQGHDVFRGKPAEVVGTTTSSADHRDIELLIQITSAQDVWRRKSCSRSDGGAGFQKGAPIELLTGHDIVLA